MAKVALAPKDAGAEFVAMLRDSPIGRKILSEQGAAEVERRTKIADEIKKLDEQAMMELPPLQAAVEAALGEFQAAEGTMLQCWDPQKRAEAAAARITSRAKLDAARNKSVAASVAHRSRHQELVQSLRDTASPYVKLFKSEMLDEFEKTRRTSIETQPVTIKLSSGGVSRAVASNSKSIAARMRAILEARDQADQLALDPDQCDIELRLEAIRQSLPAVGPPEVPK